MQRIPVQEALEELKAVQAMRGLDDDDDGESETESLRASTTDPEARVMRMADGGFRPGYNVQRATDADSRILVGVQATNSGSDLGQMTPRLEEIEQRTGRKPGQMLVDGGYVRRVLGGLAGDCLPLSEPTAKFTGRRSNRAHQWR